MAKNDETTTDPAVDAVDPTDAPLQGADTTPTTEDSSPETPTESASDSPGDVPVVEAPVDVIPPADDASDPSASSSTSEDVSPVDDSASETPTTDGTGTPIYDSLTPPTSEDSGSTATGGAASEGEPIGTAHTDTVDRAPEGAGGTGVAGEAFPDQPEVITSDAPAADPDADPLDEAAVPRPAFYGERDSLDNIRIQRYGWIGPEPLLIENGQLDEFKAFVATL